MSLNGLASTISHLEQRRQNSYYHLLSIFAYGCNEIMIETLRISLPDELPPEE
ncbi:hypothetical protein JG688_00015998 [Phytophthora aleatoria]|uniref:Uncharacterized protein n=1 Tax=Phytophthora aleatoria TaxID=2496075 RepID=A0A8J5ISG5_9STRA|nr:hypothetical protein JG688_00015998 [Phytophthora aleatoria]